jgi:3-oxoacyl-[acyl-carrier-protein] synthase-3
MKRLWQNFRVDVEKVASKVGVTDDILQPKTKTAADMEQKLLKSFLQNIKSIEVLSIFYVCIQSPDYFLPTSACLIQEKYGLRTNIERSILIWKFRLCVWVVIG